MMAPWTASHLLSSKLPAPETGICRFFRLLNGNRAIHPNRPEKLWRT